MGKVIIGATVSLDGFMNDRSGSISRLYPDLEALHETEMLQEEMRTTGAVVMGRHSYDMAQGDLTGYEYQVPIFVLTHHPPAQPPKGQNDKLTVKFITDGVESALQKAKAAAGDQQITVVGGADTARQLLQAGLVDEIHMGIVPVLFGGGLRFFDQTGQEPLDLELIRTMESPGRTDLWFKVLK